MFSKDDVGKRVTCEKYGEGVITEFAPTGSLVVKFLSSTDILWDYNLNGKLIGYDWDTKRDITLLDNILVTEEWG